MADDNAIRLLGMEWAEDGERETPEDAGIDRELGFGVVFEQRGGRTVPRLVFQQLFYEQSSFSTSMMVHGILPWDARVNYRHDAARQEHAFVVGSDGNIHISTAASGPALGNANDPVADGTTWRPY